jgi:hypothetical protein
MSKNNQQSKEQAQVVQNPYSTPSGTRNRSYSHESATQHVALQELNSSVASNPTPPLLNVSTNSVPTQPSNKKKKTVPSTVSAASTMASSTCTSTGTTAFKSAPAFDVDGPARRGTVTSHTRGRGKI